MSSFITRLFRLQVEEFLARGILKGCLILKRADEKDRIFGETISHAKAANRPIATLYLANPSSFYARVTTQADIGFAEAYIAGDFTVESENHLVTVFQVLILNRDGHYLSAPTTILTRLGSGINSILHFLNRNTLTGSRRNISAHYDLSNELFSTFLGETWVYSSALFISKHNGELTNLDEAQIAKIDAVLTKANIWKGSHVLDIGCGWGELAIRAVKYFNCKVTGITLSIEQLSLAKQRAKEEGLTENEITFELIDYRDLVKRNKKYDRIVSVEMIEAVGHEFLGTYFSCIDKLLKVNGIAVIQAITTPDQRYDAYRNGTDFIQKHIFPGGLCPSLNSIISALTKDTSLIIDSIDNIGTHYATTLGEWRRKFLESVKIGKVKNAGFDDFFIRKWIYYLSYCESGFATRTLGVLQIVLTRVNNVAVLGGPPVCSY